MRAFRFAFFLVLLLAAGCSDELLNGGDGSGGEFAISVSGGTQPTYSWSSGPALSVDVVRTSNQTVVVWRVADTTNRDIRSPVRQGVVPAGALELAAIERVLTLGVQYRVTIRLADGRSAYQDFRP
jgi:hypothetical protein